MTRAFTPPPWSAETYRPVPPHYAVFAGPVLVAARIASRDDAQLIEAAPDLFEAADAACDWLHLIAPANPVTLRLEAALAKAAVH
jgi:hypothetical protein